jgi:hypothetical protein
MMAMREPLSKRIALLIVVILLVVSILAVSFSLSAKKPVVEYSLSGYAFTPEFVFDFNPYVPFYTSTMPNSYTVVNSNTPLMVSIHWQNKANIDANFRLTLNVANAKITWFSNYSTLEATDPGFSKPSTGQTYNGSTITFDIKTEANSTIQNRYLNIFPVGNPQNFTISYSITDTSNSFSFVPLGKTSATYELTSENVYHLVE